MATISKGIKLSWDKTGNTTFEELTDLQEIPELGGETEGIEITTLADEAHMFTDGLKNYGDSLVFKFLYDKTQFQTLDKQKSECNFQVELPDGAKCTFKGTEAVKLDGVGVNAALTYSLAIKPTTAMVWA